MPHLLAAPDKFRGSADASEVAAAIASAAKSCGWSCDVAPVSDGGEGFLHVLAGAWEAPRSAWRTTRVRGPLGSPVDAVWLLQDRVAVIESAAASGLLLAGGSEANDAVGASSAGTGQLIAEAIALGATRVFLGLGGTASTDGGWDAFQELSRGRGLAGVDLVVACDVETLFLDAAATFGPQKGASISQVTFLERRLERLAQVYEDRFGVDVRAIPGSGAAGGLAGGLAVLGARLAPGFEVVSEAMDLPERVSKSQLVVTGEGFVDAESFAGKAVGGVLSLAAEAQVNALVITGDSDVDCEVPVVSLVERFGQDRAVDDVLSVIKEVIVDWLTSHTVMP